MLECFTPDAPGATRLHLVPSDRWEPWRAGHGEHARWLDACGYRAEPGTFAFLPTGGGNAAPEVLAIPAATESTWQLGGLPLALPEGRYRLAEGPPRARAELGWALGAYQFNRYRSRRRAPAQLACADAPSLDETQALAEAVCFARDLINTPAEDMGPAQLADAARALAGRFGAAVEVIEGAQLLARGYPAIHLVGRASPRAPALIDLRWGDPAHPGLTLVGKGVCFDTGGLDIKSHDGMLEMKKDMGGGAIVLGLAQALMALRLPVRLRVLVPAADNAIAGDAMRPRDIVRTRAGKTVEIGFTDAEGRLVLCDALSEACTETPDLLIDVATLTGSAKATLALYEALRRRYGQETPMQDRARSSETNSGTVTREPS